MIEIYSLEHKATAKTYVGMTSRCAYGNGILISHAKRKHGKNSFIRKILATTTDKVEADNLERFYIFTLKTLHPDGYNLALGGDGGAIHTMEMKRRLSETLKQGYIDHPERSEKISMALKGRPSPNLGRSMSTESKAKLVASLLRTAFRHSSATKELMRIKFTGRVMSDETKQKMSESAKLRAARPEFIARNTGSNNPMSRPEIAARSGAAQRGKKLTDEHKLKISIAGKGRPSANKGKTFGPDVRAKMSASGKGRPKSEEHKHRLSTSNKAFAAKKKEALQ